MKRSEYDYLCKIKENIRYSREVLNWSYKDISFWIDGIIFSISLDYSNELINEIREIRDLIIRGVKNERS